MNARQLIAAATERLAEAGVASPEYDAAELLAFVAGTTRLQLGLADISDDQLKQYDVLVDRRASVSPSST